MRPLKAEPRFPTQPGESGGVFAGIGTGNQTGTKTAWAHGVSAMFLIALALAHFKTSRT